MYINALRPLFAIVQCNNAIPDKKMCRRDCYKHCYVDIDTIVTIYVILCYIVTRL